MKRHFILVAYYIHAFSFTILLADVN